ncbi:Ring-h2 finger protein atl16 [Thalictrum thalictroides]|uniref:RING-type E3 ubiquitin transferase n=1 Tax=Thalictrum thalictroides TaxID=46969 RepID=A0A7J6UU00_THATH|nr:Ring-h2 finger protein atl16 [Thalictrum thalictroides]
MDSVRRSLIQYGSQALPLMRNQQQTVYRTPSPPSDTSSPILVIAILGITLTAFVLLGYYIFVIKCWLNGFLRHIVTTQTQRFEDPLMTYEPAPENRGADESVIQALPVLQFRKGEGIEDAEKRSYFECAVCLNEFQDEEKLRVLPSCSHVFHIDCIDIWLQSNANCPLCRSSISNRTRVLPIHIIAPSPSPQDQTPFTETTIGGDEDFVVIEVRGSSSADQTTHTHRRQDTAKSGELLSKSINPSPRKLEQRLITKKQRKFHHGASLGDECIDTRGKDDQFSVQSVRRSFSMDSSTDRQLFLAVQDIIQQNRPLHEVSTSAGCSSRVRRSIFLFGHGCG